MSFIDGIFQAAPCEAHETYGGKPCGATHYQHLSPKYDEFGRALDDSARCLTCGTVYEVEELDAMTDADEARRAA